MTGPIEQSSATVKLFGARNSPPAYSIRDFLHRPDEAPSNFLRVCFLVCCWRGCRCGCN